MTFRDAHASPGLRHLRAFAAVLLIIALTATSCVTNVSRTHWDDPTEISRAPLTDPRTSEDGRCVRDYNVEYHQTGKIVETTRNFRSATIGAAALALTSVAAFYGAVAWNDPYLLVTSLGMGLSSVVWGFHTLIVRSSVDAPVETSRNTTKKETLEASGCGAPTNVASTNGAAAACKDGELVDRKLQQLEELKRDGLVDETAYVAERDALEASRCPDGQVAGGSTVRERLERLEKLRADGLVTEIEYKEQRSAILDEL